MQYSLSLPLVLVLLGALFLAGCGSKARPHRNSYDPYTVNGVTYYPLKDARGYRAQGTASYYGSAFHGRKTASGEDYDQDELTCAHTTLPFSTKVRVTNLHNGRSVLVRVNDRGPFKKGRIVDLSKAAAHRLDMLKRGTARVLVEYADDQPKPMPVQENAAFCIQVGAFAEKRNAERLAQKLRQKGYRPKIEQNKGSLWHVQVGPFADQHEAEITLALLQMIAGQAYLIGQ